MLHGVANTAPDSAVCLFIQHRKIFAAILINLNKLIKINLLAAYTLLAHNVINKLCA